jgi:hypothetical protein
MGRTCHNGQINKWTVNNRCICRQYILLPKMCNIYLKPSSGTCTKDDTELTTQAMYVKRDNAASSCSHCCSGKAIIIIYSACVFVALVIQHSKHMRRIVLSSVASPTLQYFPTLSHKVTTFGKSYRNMKCVFWFSLQLLSEIFLILRIIPRDIVINVYRSSC